MLRLATVARQPSSRVTQGRGRAIMLQRFLMVDRQGLELPNQMIAVIFHHVRHDIVRKPRWQFQWEYCVVVAAKSENWLAVFKLVTMTASQEGDKVPTNRTTQFGYSNK